MRFAPKPKTGTGEPTLSGVGGNVESRTDPETSGRFTASHVVVTTPSTRTSAKNFHVTTSLSVRLAMIG
jgi:hypothetical protein